MARPEKIGLDYFPMDVDFFEDDKLRFIEARFNEKGELITVKLLCKIFKAGYYIKWDEDMSLLFSSTAGKNITPGLANDIVNELVKRGFFNKNLFERFNILTSNGIQKRYLNICKLAKRKSAKISENFLIKELTHEDLELTQEETPQNPSESTQSKVKESKVKESKIENIGDESPPQKSFKNFSEKEFIEEIAKYRESFDKEMLNSFFKHWKEKSPSGKMKFQLQQTWETKLRLHKWKLNQTNFKHGTKTAVRQLGQSVEFGTL